MPRNYSFSHYKHYYSSILKLGLPIMLGQLGVIVTGFADTVMVGHYSTEALASASFVNNVFTLVMVACMGFSYGITPIVGALFALGDVFPECDLRGLHMNITPCLRPASCPRAGSAVQRHR